MTIPDGPSGSDKIETDLQSVSPFKGKRNRAWLQLFFISKCLCAAVGYMHFPFHMEKGARIKSETRQVIYMQRQDFLRSRQKDQITR